MAFQGDSIFWVEVNKVTANPFQPRREFDESKLQELADSIRMYGILQPLTVTKKEINRDDGAFYSEYELIAGERRLRASKLAGLEQVPVIIRSGEDTEQEKLELAIIENLQREDLNAVDRALAFKQLAETFELSHGKVAKKVGRSREYVSNTIRLLLLPECMLSSLSMGDISEGHARSLLMLKDRPEEQDVVFREILLKKLSVREVERITRKIASDKVRKKNWVNTDPGLIEIERQFTDTLGTRVQISKTDFGGKLTIDYFSEDDLQNLLLIVRSQGKMSHPVEVNEDEVKEESGPVMQAAGAAVMAKLSEATPLQATEESVPPVEPVVSEEKVANEVKAGEGQETSVPVESNDQGHDSVWSRPQDEIVQETKPTEFVTPTPEVVHENSTQQTSDEVAYNQPEPEPEPPFSHETNRYSAGSEVNSVPSTPPVIEENVIQPRTEINSLTEEKESEQSSNNPETPDVAAPESVQSEQDKNKEDEGLYSISNFCL